MGHMCEKYEVFGSPINPQQIVARFYQVFPLLQRMPHLTLDKHIAFGNYRTFIKSTYYVQYIVISS